MRGGPFGVATEEAGGHVMHLQLTHQRLGIDPIGTRVNSMSESGSAGLPTGR